MTRVGLTRRQVVDRFTTRMWGVSSDGQVHSDGETLCVGCRPVARWENGTVCLTRLDSLGIPGDLGPFVRGYIHQHLTVRRGVQHVR